MQVRVLPRALSHMHPITFRRWANLVYVDPADKLRRLRVLEREIAERLAGEELEPGARDVLALRTNETKSWREWRDAALFTYGMGLAMGKAILFAPVEDEDYDVVAKWVDGDETNFCPVQHKDLPSEDRNPNATIEGLLRDLPKRYAPSKTVLLVKLSRAGHVVLDRDWPAVPFAQLWFLWASAPGGVKWSIYGDALAAEPGQWAFDYPP